jgi:alkyldihydroxyacetonephosphate synthase
MVYLHFKIIIIILLYLTIFNNLGHTMDELFILRYGKFERIPDLVVWPVNQSEVETLVNLASKHNVAIIPYGG